MNWARQQRAGNSRADSARNEEGASGLPGGLTGWLLARLRSRKAPRPRLELLERISLAPRQSLALVEAEGRRFLVATSAEGGPAFYPLDDQTPAAGNGFAAALTHAAQRTPAQRARVSW